MLYLYLYIYKCILSYSKVQFSTVQKSLASQKSLVQYTKGHSNMILSDLIVFERCYACLSQIMLSCNFLLYLVISYCSVSFHFAVLCCKRYLSSVIICQIVLQRVIPCNYILHHILYTSILFCFIPSILFYSIMLYALLYSLFFQSCD